MGTGNQNYTLALTVTANTSQALAAVKQLTGQMAAAGGKGMGGITDGASGGFSKLSTVARSAFGIVTGGVGFVAGAIRSVLGGAISLATTALKGLLAVGGAASAGVYGVYKALGPAADMEQYSIQLEVMLGSAEKAKARLADLRKFSAETPFELPGVIEAANLMQAFGIYSKRNLTAAGDAASAFGKDLTEVVTSLNMLAGGRGGEAMESLARLGVTRAKLSTMGVKFDAQGALVTPATEAFNIVIRYFEKNFGGMMARQANTFKGVMSNLKDTIFNAFADAGKGLLTYAKPAIKEITTMVESVGKAVAKIDWSSAGEKFNKSLSFARGIITDLLENGEKGKTLRKDAGDLWTSLRPILADFPKALLTSMGAFGGEFINSLGTTLALAWQGLAGTFGLAWRGLLAILGTAWNSLSNRIKDALTLGFDTLVKPGTREYRQAEAEVDRELKNAPEWRRSRASNEEKEKYRTQLIENRFWQLRYGVDEVKNDPGFKFLSESIDAGNTEKILLAMKGSGENLKQAGKVAWNVKGGAGEAWDKAVSTYENSDFAKNLSGRGTQADRDARGATYGRNYSIYRATNQLFDANTGKMVYKNWGMEFINEQQLEAIRKSKRMDYDLSSLKEIEPNSRKPKSAPAASMYEFYQDSGVKVNGVKVWSRSFADEAEMQRRAQDPQWKGWKYRKMDASELPAPEKTGTGNDADRANKVLVDRMPTMSENIALMKSDIKDLKLIMQAAFGGAPA